MRGEEYWPTSKVKIIVGRDEDTDPPRPSFVNGHMDLTGLHPYYDSRKNAYQGAALEAADRLIKFFKYKLHNPNLPKLGRRDFRNPAWSVEGGMPFSPTLIFDSPLYMPDQGFGIKHLSSQSMSDLEDALQNPIQPSLSEELMSDAQSALLNDNLRQATLEMAIACEVAVKQAFFAKATPAGAAYEYLEEKRSVRVPVVDLIDSIAKSAFGASFREDENSHYKHIDLLYRCRNKVAHRGELMYKDDSGTVCTVNKDTLAIWWGSVLNLLEWLRAKTPS